MRYLQIYTAVHLVIVVILQIPFENMKSGPFYSLFSSLRIITGVCQITNPQASCIAAYFSYVYKALLYFIVSLNIPIISIDIEESTN